MMTVDQMIEVLQAFKAGKKIQVRSIYSMNEEDWDNLVIPSWQFGSFNYRVKPELREYLVAIDSAGEPIGVTKASCGFITITDTRYPLSGVRAIKVQEVLE